MCCLAPATYKVRYVLSCSSHIHTQLALIYFLGKGRFSAWPHTRCSLYWVAPATRFPSTRTCRAVHVKTSWTGGPLHPSVTDPTLSSCRRRRSRRGRDSVNGYIALWRQRQRIHSLVKRALLQSPPAIRRCRRRQREMLQAATRCYTTAIRCYTLLYDSYTLLHAAIRQL
jgi:hypothetical protein